MKDSLLDINFGAGIDEVTRPELLDPRQGFPVRENLRSESDGSASRRLGFSPLSLARQDGTSRSAGYKLITDDKTIGVIDVDSLDVYDTQADEWADAGRVCEIGYAVHDVPAVGQAVYVGDVEACGGYIAIGSEDDAGTAYVTVLDEDTRAMVLAPADLDGDDPPLIGSYGDRYFLAFVPDAGTTTIVAWILDTTDLDAGWTSLATVTAAWDWGSTTIGKMQVCSLADRVAVAYTLGSGTNRVEVKTYDATGLLETTTIGTSSTDPDCLAMDGSNADTLWVAWNESTAVKAIGLTGDALATVKATASTIMTTASAASQLKIAMHTTSAGKARVAASVLTTPHSIAMRGVQTSAGAAATDGSQIVVPNATPIGRAFHHGGRYYLGVLPDVSRTLRSPVLCDWTDDVTYVRPVANPIPDQAEFGTVDGKWASGSSSSKRFAGLSVTRSAVATVAQLVEIDFADPQRWKTTSHERSTFLTGALATYFDGRRVQEVGFLAPPPKPTTTNSGTGITVTRTYVAVYEDVDADGNWIVSGISDPSDSVTVTDKTVTVTSAPLSVSWRAGGSSLRVAFYAAVNGSPPYYRLGSVANDTSSLTVSYSDTTTDADLVKAQTLYAQNLPSTPGESLDRRAPPGLMHLVSYNGMLVGSDGRSVFWSGQPVSGEATWFSPVFQAPLAGCSGLAAQDGSLYAFTRNAIYVTSGDVPSDNGASGGLGTFRRLVVDVGCIDARSIVTTSLGTFFQSDRGIELLNRSGAVEWVGRPVSVTTAAFPVCVGATLDADGERVIFELAAAESDNQVSGSGRAAVYNLVRRHWESTDRRKNNAGAADTAAQSACVVYSGGAYRYAWLGTDGRVYVERATDDAAAHLDPGSAWITMKAQTSWIHAGGLQGEQSVDRILFLGARSSGLDLTIETYFDYVDALPESKTFTAAQIAALSRMWLDREVSQSTSNAIRVILSDATPSSGVVGTGQGATWIGLSFPGIPHQGVKRTSSAQRGGS